MTTAMFVDGPLDGARLTIQPDQTSLTYATDPHPEQLSPPIPEQVVTYTRRRDFFGAAWFAPADMCDMHAVVELGGLMLTTWWMEGEDET